MIFIDASRYNNTEQRTGVENYSYFLINKIVKRTSGNITLISPRKIDLQVKQIIIPFPRLWTQIRLSWEVLWNKKIDNLFVPSHLMPIVYPKNTTITIHDVAFKRFPKSYGLLSRLYLDWGNKFAVKHAKNIVVPSVATKDDLIELYKCNPKKITIITLGFKQKTIVKTTSMPTNYNLTDKNYFLYIGRIEHKKNTDTLIKAFKKFAEKNNAIKLVLVGFQGHGGKKIIANIPKTLKNRIILTGYVSNEIKSALLQNALAFIFPSRYEGFGIPILEAMQYDLPIICSNIPSSKEILGDNALFFETEKVTELAKQFKKITITPDLRIKLTKKYSQILSEYSWDICAKKTLDIINS